jgi:transcriptional regulator with XRE-family HTH domain
MAVLVRTRREKKLSQADIAQRLGIRQPMLSKVENGQQQLGILDFVRYCRAVDADPTTLIAQLQAALKL